MICGRPLLLHKQETRVLDKQQIVEEEIKEVEILLEKYDQDLKVLDIRLQNHLEQKLVLQEELDQKSRSYVSPFVDELERLLYAQNQISSDIELLDQQLRQWSILEEREKELSQMSAEKTKLQTALAELDTRDDTKSRK